MTVPDAQHGAIYDRDECPTCCPRCGAREHPGRCQLGLYEAGEPHGPVTGHGGPWPRGRWSGKGTTGRSAIYARRRHGFRGYWWYVGLDGWHRGLEWCEHAHQSVERAQACGKREARRRNEMLDRSEAERA